MMEIVKNLLKIKSIITILSTIAFLILLLRGDTVPQEFLLIYSTIIAFYFGTQAGKKERMDDEEQVQNIPGTNG